MGEMPFPIRESPPIPPRAGYILVRGGLAKKRTLFARLPINFCAFIERLSTMADFNQNLLTLGRALTDEWAARSRRDLAQPVVLTLLIIVSD